jgi:Tfp pilus assembly protein PilN
MPQQINLCIAVLTPQRQRFQARSLLTILVVALVALGALGAFWLWSLEGSSQSYRQTLDAQTSEIHNLQAVIQSSRAASGPADPALQKQLQDLLARIQEREKLLQIAQQGLFKPGEGHSDRLLLLSRSIPADVWVTSLKADGSRYDVSGLTLEPASLNDWVSRLGQHPLMHELKLNAVNVNFVVDAGAPGVTAKPMWSFSLMSAIREAPVAAPAAAVGKP